MAEEVIIRFANMNVAKANQLAETLRTAILNAAPTAQIKRRKDSQETQDFGATLGIILAGPAIVAIAKGIQVWLEKYRGADVEITTPDGKVIAKNITARRMSWRFYKRRKMLCAKHERSISKTCNNGRYNCGRERVAFCRPIRSLPAIQEFRHSFPGLHSVD